MEKKPLRGVSSTLPPLGIRRVRENSNKELRQALKMFSVVNENKEKHLKS